MTKHTSPHKYSIPESETKFYEYVTRGGETRSIRVAHCTECGKPFFPARSDAVTDSDKCRKARSRRLKREAKQAQLDMLSQLRFE